ncbi:MAG: hypothetical protein ABI227_02360 [Rhodanobacter sp.]
MKSNHCTPPIRPKPGASKASMAFSFNIIRTSIRPNNISLKVSICLETVAAQRFHQIASLRRKNLSIKIPLSGQVEFASFRRLRQMNGTRLKLFLATCLPGQKSSTPCLAGASTDMAGVPTLVVEGSGRDNIFRHDGIDNDARTRHQHRREHVENRTRIMSMPSIQIDQRRSECVCRMHDVMTRCKSAIARTDGRPRHVTPVAIPETLPAALGGRQHHAR